MVGVNLFQLGLLSYLFQYLVGVDLFQFGLLPDWGHNHKIFREAIWLLSDIPISVLSQPKKIVVVVVVVIGVVVVVVVVVVVHVVVVVIPVVDPRNLPLKLG